MTTATNEPPQDTPLVPDEGTQLAELETEGGVTAEQVQEQSPTPGAADSSAQPDVAVSEGAAGAGEARE